jgi:pimeloyl-ACP methyl ester carboxylesterase
MTDTQIMDLPDGRELAWLELGQPDRPPVIAFHGTPGSRLQMAFGKNAIDEAAVRFIAPDRPGYGHSTYHANRRLVDWASDVAHLADHLGVGRFSVMGVSGGGPHAAVCARLLPDRVVAAAIVSGVGPPDVPGADEGMVPLNKALVFLARRWPALTTAVFGAELAAGRRWPERMLELAPRTFPAPDVEVLQRPEIRRLYVEDLRRSSSTAARAASQDFALFAKDWGFRLEDISVPVDIWHGDLDQSVPLAQGRIQAERIEGAKVHECQGEGHLLLVDHLEEILRRLLP